MLTITLSRRPPRFHRLRHLAPATPEERGELQTAIELATTYGRLPPDERPAFAQQLAVGWSREAEQALANAQRVLDAGGASISDVRRALETPSLGLLRRVRNVDGGPAVAVELRAELRALRDADPAAAALEQELHELLAAWFEPSSFELRRVTWDAPASLLETLASLEAVHAVRDWDDLKNRVDADRRVYALFQPLLGDVPIAFTQIATTTGLATSVDALLDDSAPTTDPESADTAVFYSISATQPGMSGLGVGTTLIARAIAELRAELPQLKTFATLSPLPGFVQWLRQEHPDAKTSRLLEAASSADDAARIPLLRLAARYVLSARDPVTNFHLGNGARAERLNWQADRSPTGLRTSAGVMVNYVYPLRKRGRNRLRYLEEGSVSASGSIHRLASASA